MKNILLLAALFTLTTLTAQEKLEINWPKASRLVVSNVETEAVESANGPVNMITTEWLEEGHTIDTSITTALLLTLEGLVIPDLQTFADASIEEWEAMGVTTTVTVLESGITNRSKNYLLFSLTMPKTDIDVPCSLLYYALASDENTYLAYVSVDGESFPKGFVEEYTKVFKESKLAEGK